MKRNGTMRKIFSCAVLPLMLVLAASASAPSVGGSWKADVPRGNGRFITAVFDFEVDGSSLTGLVHAATREFPLVDGKIKGNEISFSVDGATGFFTGQLDGDELKMKVKYDGGENGSKTMPFTAVRVTK